MNGVDLRTKADRFSPMRCLAAMACLVAFALTGIALAADARWQVGIVVIGKPYSKMEQKCATDFASELTRRGLPADTWAGPADWQSAPPGVDPDRWLALTAVRLDDHLELLLFRPRAGVVDLIARQPATMNNYGTPVIHTGPSTGPGQDMRYAAIYVASDAAAILARPEPTAPGRLARVTVDSTGMPGVEKSAECLALAFAAASRAGLRPTAQDQPLKLTFGLSRPGNMNRLRVVCADAARTRTLECPFAPNDGLIELLTTAARSVTDWSLRPAALAFVHPAPVTLFGVKGAAILLESNRRVAALDTVEGTLAWITPVDTYKSMAFAGRVTPNGAVVYQRAPFIEELSLTGGRATPVARARPSHPWSFDRSRDNHLIAVAEGPKLTLFDEARSVWTRDGSSRWTAGPQITTPGVVAADEAGRVICLSRDPAARELWTLDTAERLYGPLTPIGDKLLASSQEGILLAFTVADGRLLWKAKLDDRIVGLPVAAGNAIAAASGDGGVRRFDPATGAPLQNWKPHCAITHFGASSSRGGRLVCADLSGVVTVLAAADLRVIASIAVPGGIAAMTVAPQPRSAADAALGARDDAVILASRTGVITVIPLSSETSAGGEKPQ